MRTTALAAALCILSPLAVPSLAHGQDLTVHDGWMLTPEAGKPGENGIGSPTVAYVPDTDTWVMFFEARYGSGAPCTQGIWGIGRATSPDGLTWTVDDDFALQPKLDSYYDCVMAHPSVTYDDGTWTLFFKAHQNAEACADTDNVPSWGCSLVTGIGVAQSTNGTDWTVSEEPIYVDNTIGFPRATKVDGVWNVFFERRSSATSFEIWRTTSSDEGATWSDVARVLQPGFADWVEEEVFNPAVTCDPNDTTGIPLTMWAGGANHDDDNFATVRTMGVGLAVSQTGAAWFWDPDTPALLRVVTPEDGNTEAEQDWRHWDVLRTGDEHLIYFAERFADDGNKPRVGLAYTYAEQQTALDEANIRNGVCDFREDTDLPEDTDPTDSTGSTDPTDSTEPSDSHSDDTDTGEPPPGCEEGCSQASSGGVGALGLALGLVGVLRRRRR